MGKNEPDAAAEKLVARLRRAQQGAGTLTADWALGQYVLEALRASDSVSRVEVLAHFHAIATDAKAGEAERAQAAEVIRRLDR